MVCVFMYVIVCECVSVFARGSGHRPADSERAVCEHKSVTARIKKMTQASH